MTRIMRERTMTRRRFVAATGLLGFSAFVRAGPAQAAYPDRPIKIVVANTPGGPSDIIARIMAAAMQEPMGASVFVENKGGAGGNIGMGSVARADPDGYTILLSTSAYAVNPGLYQTLPYDPLKDFTAICELAVTPHVFAVKPDLGAATMKEFVALAKANPDKFNVSTPPIGTTPQLQVEVLKLREGLQGMATVVFTGGGDALKALLGGTVQLSSGTLAPAHPHIKAGTIKGLALTGRTRWHDLPEIPTMLEAGYPDFVFETYTALMAPAKTPPDIVARLQQVALEILRRPDIRAKLTESGFEVTAMPGKEHMARIAREVPMFADIIARAGIKKL
ncbi:MAG TPA: tripartite tricarboxylate transporter substrate-binding protein [Xanthobacteraceae bacterium]|nr:tripartite tricarboxylate transporter substrate-binding protein [Xanthobacteraceae bacterium]